MEGDGNLAEAGANQLGDGRLNGLFDEGGRRGDGFFGDEGIVHKGDAAILVVDTDVELATASTAHDIGLDLLVVVGPFKPRFSQGGHQRQEVRNFDGAVHLGELSEKAGVQGPLNEGKVERIKGVGGQGLEDFGDGGAQGQRLEINLEDAVELLYGFRGKLEDVTGQGVLKQSRARRHLVESEESSEARVLALELFRLVLGDANRDSKCADEDLAGEAAHFLLGLAADAAHNGVVPRPGRRMEEGIPAHQKYLGEFFVVVSHHRGARGFLSQGEEVVDILNGAESFLPELELDGGVELREASVEMVLKDVRVREVDGVLLVRVFGNVGEMEAECLAETTEFDFSLVFQAEFEGLLRDLLFGF